jgi:hypothetical protein
MQLQRFNGRVGGTNESLARTYYDARAMPVQILLQRNGETSQTQASTSH